MGLHNRIVPGDRRGSYTVLEIFRDNPKYPKYRVRCDCGTTNVISGGTLWKEGQCRSCCRLGQPLKYGNETIANNSLYRSWASMRWRCNPENITKRNKTWAGRGISIWWALSHGYAKGLSLDRIDVDGNYEPSNCQWVIRSVNSKRARANYHFVRRNKYCFYDEACYGDF